ncbi:uncharacterized protein YALI1_A11588g [Yarrowia lipolytica]|uniref:Uncharacterized protein n=1 Tax=Yarrowia lipolytica TaxID=4952 RepID=A0A1D8N4G0_YARLL|nr:hypothetical protein YALI1_A11588g [Yarrowia lipolytica]
MNLNNTLSTCNTNVSPLSWAFHKVSSIQLHPQTASSHQSSPEVSKGRLHAPLCPITTRLKTNRRYKYHGLDLIFSYWHTHFEKAPRRRKKECPTIYTQQLLLLLY